MTTEATEATEATAGRRPRSWLLLLVGLVVALVLAGIVSFYASSEPDGLEKVASDHALDANAQDSATADSPLADYGVSGIENPRLSVGLAGVIGVGVTFLVAGGAFLLIRRRDTSAT